LFSTIVLILGVLLVVAGLVEIFRAGSPVPPAPTPTQAGAESFLSDLKESLAQLNTFLGQFQQKFRVGVLLLTFGVGLIGLAGYIESKKLKDDVNKATKTSAVVRLPA
jgi:uncharacterized membrane protein (UPF0136 family)